MVEPVDNSVSYDNPLSLAAQSSHCIVLNINHYVIERTISGKTFYLWKAGLLLSFWELEQIFQAAFELFGKFDPKWITLFLGSRRRAVQFITLLATPIERGFATDEAFSHILAQRYLSLRLVDKYDLFRYDSSDEHLNFSGSPVLSDLPDVSPLSISLSRHSAQISHIHYSDNSPANTNEINLNARDRQYADAPHDNPDATIESDVTQEPKRKKKRLREDSGGGGRLGELLSRDESLVSDPSSAEELQTATPAASTTWCVIGQSSQQLEVTSASANFLSYSGVSDKRVNRAIDYTGTGTMRRLVIRNNVPMPAPELLAGLLACSELLEITLENCANLHSKFEVLELIAAHCPRLTTLKLYRCDIALSQCFDLFAAASPPSPRSLGQFAAGLDLSHLQVLALRDLPAVATLPHWVHLVFHVADRVSTQLLELDLSGADFSYCTSFEWLSCLRRLRVLLLANCKLPEDRTSLIGAICELHDLFRLDLQQLLGEQEIDVPPIRVDEYDNPALVMRRLSESLPQLSYLDLSYTNLSGTGQDATAENPLPGWPSGRMLSFLGLWGCPSEACFRENLPAHRIAGEANIEQMTAALESYAGSQLAVRIILKSLMDGLNQTNDASPVMGRCLELVVECAQRYPKNIYDSNLQTRANEVLYSLIRLLHIENISPLRVRKLVHSLVGTLERYLRGPGHIVRSCCLILLKVCTYKQLTLLFERLVRLLLIVAQRPPYIVHFGDRILQVMALDLLRVILRQVDVSEKRAFGEAGGVLVALTILEQLLNIINQNVDAIIVACWRLLCSATDGTPHNCELFVERGGLELFSRCLLKWSGHKDLYLEMFGVVNDVAETKCVRGHLKSDLFIDTFRKLLEISDVGNRISYYAAGVLSQMLSDGEHLWHHHGGCADAALPPAALGSSRAAIGEQIVAAIDRWDSNAIRDMSFRSLLPLLSLIESSDALAPQYFAAWSLNSLTLVQPNKYCPLLVREGALDRLDAVIADARSPDKLRHWLVLTADRIRPHERAAQPSAPPPQVLLVDGDLNGS